MRAAIAVVILIATAGAATQSYSFAPPADGIGTATTDGASWAILVLQPGSTATITALMDVPIHQVVTTVERQFLEADRTNYSLLPPTSQDDPSNLTPPGEITFRAPDHGPASFAIQALRVAAQIDDAQFTLAPLPLHPGEGNLACGYHALTEHEFQRQRVMRDGPCSEAPHVVLRSDQGDDQNTTLKLDAKRIQAIYVHNMAVSCTGDAESCPRGGSRSTQRTGSDEPRVIIQRDQYVKLTPRGDASLTLTGKPASFVLGAEGPYDLQVDGEIRLPTATRDCPSPCLGPSNQTYLAAGNLTLQGLAPHPGDSSRMTATIVGDPTAVRLDEAWILTPEGLSTAAAAGILAAIIGVASKLIYAPLLTKKSPDELLKNKNRRAMYDYILANPGSTFRQMIAAVDIASGTARHHVNVMQRADMIQVEQHSQTLRFFENHGRFADSWSDVVALREEPLRQLHGWLLENPGSAQKDVGAAAATWGWSRSTMQHRLLRLQNAGLVTQRSHGRRKLYTAKPTELPRPA